MSNASDLSSVSFLARLAQTSILAAGFAIAVGVSGAQSAVIDPSHGLPPGMLLDMEVEDAWWGQWKGRANEAAMHEALAGLFTGLALTDPWKLDGLSGGQDTIFTYNSDPRQAFAIKYGGLWIGLLFDAPTTGWTITGVDHEVSQLVGFNGNDITTVPLPIPLPTSAILFLSALLGLATLGRMRNRRVTRSM